MEGYTCIRVHLHITGTDLQRPYIALAPTACQARLALSVLLVKIVELARLVLSQSAVAVAPR